MKYPLVAPLAALVAGIIAAQFALFSFQETLLSILLLTGLGGLGLRYDAARAGLAACLAGFVLGRGHARLSVRPAGPFLDHRRSGSRRRSSRRPHPASWLRANPPGSFGERGPLCAGIRVSLSQHHRSRRRSRDPLPQGELPSSEAGLRSTHRVSGADSAAAQFRKPRQLRSGRVSESPRYSSDRRGPRWHAYAHSGGDWRKHLAVVALEASRDGATKTGCAVPRAAAG